MRRDREHDPGCMGLRDGGRDRQRGHGSTHTVTATVHLGNDPDEVAVDPVTQTVYVANGVTATVPVGRPARGVAVDSVSHTANAVNSNTHGGKGTLWVIDPRKGLHSVVRRFTLPIGRGSRKLRKPSTPKRYDMIRALLVAGAIAAAATEAAPMAGADPVDQLRSLLPTGYGPNSCKPPAVRQPMPGEVAALECWDNSLPGGPTYAYYRLYTDRDKLSDAFSGEWGGSRQAYWWFQPCPGWEGIGTPAPATWHRDKTPDEVAGRIKCGSVNGPVHGNSDAKSIMWTRDPTCSSASPKDTTSPACTTGGSKTDDRVIDRSDLEHPSAARELVVFALLGGARCLRLQRMRENYA